MTDYLFAFHGGSMPEDPDEIAKEMAAWGAWMESLGDALVNPGNPVGKSHTVSAAGVVDNGGPDPLSGFSIVRAESLEAALEMAKTCPHISDGTIEVAPIVEMEM